MNLRETQQTDILAEGFVNVPEAARILGLSKSKVYGMMDAGELSFAKFGKSRRIPRQALRECVNRCLVGA